MRMRSKGSPNPKGKRIPSLTLAGGKLSDFGGRKAAVQFRFWVHPKNGGDDFYYPWTNYAELAEMRAHYIKTRRSEYSKVEPIIAVVFDTKARRYREVVIDRPRKKKDPIWG